MDIETTVIKNLIKNEEYARKVLPFLKEEYFRQEEDKLLYKLISEFIVKYNTLPTENAILVDLSSVMNLNQSTFDLCKDKIEIFKKTPALENIDWLLDVTENFCKDRAIVIAMSESLEIMNDPKHANRKGIIPQMLSDAIATSFDPHVGHDYLQESDMRYDYMHRPMVKIPFDLDYMNKITNGGVETKSLNIILAGTGVGKTLAMCHFAAANLIQGKNVLYITMEMAEEKIAERIDANLLNIALDDLKKIPKVDYEKRVNNLKSKTNGKLIIKEYPTANASTIHFRALLNELLLKKKFKPDIIYVDYLNICTSARLKMGSNVNSYTYIKAIAEELRGLAVEYGIPIWSATQTTRGGYSNSDPGLEDTSESFGLPATADFMIAMITTEDLDNLNQIMVKQLKNRYADVNLNKRFVIGVDRTKMRLYDVANSAQLNIVDSGQPKPNKFGGIKVE